MAQPPYNLEDFENNDLATINENVLNTSAGSVSLLSSIDTNTNKTWQEIDTLTAFQVITQVKYIQTTDGNFESDVNSAISGLQIAGNFVLSVQFFRQNSSTILVCLSYR